MRYIVVFIVVVFGFLGFSLEAQNYLVVYLDDTTGPVISKHIYGHFSEHLGRCIYEGYWVSPESGIPAKSGIRQDVVNALKETHIPNLRWPGGCFADTYHWKDGIGTPEQRAKIINTHWGGVTEDNSFGTHEFMELCDQLGTEAFISGNMGSGTVEEMAQWVEYLTSGNESPMTELRKQNGRAEPWKVAFWGLGNEPWGCGGNMDAEQYADEWGNWYDVEPGTNPGFLYQQNSLRDALTAAINLHIFNDHAERVKGANLAQTVNVLQALILTEGEKMVKTPTYYTFKLLKEHQDAQRLTTHLISEPYTYKKEHIPALTASASRNQKGVVHISITNSNPTKMIPLHMDLIGKPVKLVTGRIITGDRMDSYNTFDKEEEVSDRTFQDFKLSKDVLDIQVPPKSIIMIELKQY